MISSSSAFDALSFAVAAVPQPFFKSWSLAVGWVVFMDGPSRHNYLLGSLSLPHCYITTMCRIHQHLGLVCPYHWGVSPENPETRMRDAGWSPPGWPCGLLGNPNLNLICNDCILDGVVRSKASEQDPLVPSFGIEVFFWGEKGRFFWLLLCFFFFFLLFFAWQFDDTDSLFVVPL